MFLNLISKFKGNKKINCLLIIPPLLDPTTFYPATPILVGQLEANGYEVKNLDLNIKFFNKILSKEYINKTKELLDKKNIKYDDTNYNFLLENIDNAIAEYRKFQNNTESFKNAKK